METATFWSSLSRLHAEVTAAVTGALDGHSPPVLCHISPVYETGASLYVTVAAREHDDPIAQWAAAKQAAGDTIVVASATITHQHAAGRDHLPWLADAIGPVGVEMLRGEAAARPTGRPQPRRPRPLTDSP